MGIDKKTKAFIWIAPHHEIEDFSDFYFRSTIQLPSRLITSLKMKLALIFCIGVVLALSIKEAHSEKRSLKNILGDMNVNLRQLIARGILKNRKKCSDGGKLHKVGDIWEIQRQYEDGNVKERCRCLAGGAIGCGPV